MSPFFFSADVDGAYINSYVGGDNMPLAHREVNIRAKLSATEERIPNDRPYTLTLGWTTWSWLYEHYGCEPGHANCHDNYVSALSQVGVEPMLVPNPLNLWMNVPVVDNNVTITAPLSKPGDYIVLRAEADVIVVLSACPMDVAPANGAAAINGPDLEPKSVHYRVE